MVFSSINDSILFLQRKYDLADKFILPNIDFTLALLAITFDPISLKLIYICSNYRMEIRFYRFERRVRSCQFLASILNNFLNMSSEILHNIRFEQNNLH